jgi:hypothetical protein
MVRQQLEEKNIIPELMAWLKHKANRYPLALILLHF